MVWGKKRYTTGVSIGTSTFVVYINTMVDVMDNFEIFLFVNDAKVFHEISSNSDSNNFMLT